MSRPAPQISFEFFPPKTLDASFRLWETARALAPFAPGAHIDVVMSGGSDGELVRQYSLCGSPADRKSWRVAVLREPDGRGGSAAAHAVQVGDTVSVGAMIATVEAGTGEAGAAGAGG